MEAAWAMVKAGGQSAQITITPPTKAAASHRIIHKWFRQTFMQLDVQRRNVERPDPLVGMELGGGRYANMDLAAKHIGAAPSLMTWGPAES